MLITTVIDKNQDIYRHSNHLCCPIRAATTSTHVCIQQKIAGVWTWRWSRYGQSKTRSYKSKDIKLRTWTGICKSNCYIENTNSFHLHPQILWNKPLSPIPLHQPPNRPSPHRTQSHPILYAHTNQPLSILHKPICHYRRIFQPSIQLSNQISSYP